MKYFLIRDNANIYWKHKNFNSERLQKSRHIAILGNKDADKGRLHPSRSSTEDVGAKSPLSSSRSSLFEKYSFPATKTSERPASVLDRYNRATSREKSREPDVVSRYGSNTYPGSSLARAYGNESRIEKKERADHPPVSYRGLRPNSGRNSREPSPEINVGKSNSFRMYARAPSYGRSSATSSESIFFFLLFR